MIIICDTDFLKEKDHYEFSEEEKNRLTNNN